MSQPIQIRLANHDWPRTLREAESAARDNIKADARLSEKHIGWQLLRDEYRCQHSGCGAHLQAGRDHPRSAVVHHLKPHKGDLELFFDLDNLQSVCWTCHSGDIQSQEALGYDSTIGSDGWPTDPRHPSMS